MIPDRPEISLGWDILVADLAGWKKERFPADEPFNRIPVTPDWVCGILLSPTADRVDRAQKMPIYLCPAPGVRCLAHRSHPRNP